LRLLLARQTKGKRKLVLSGFCNGYNQVMPATFVPAGIIALTLLVLTESSVSQTRLQSECLSYDPSVVTLSGTLVRKTFPGPPNYESVKKGDKPETSWLLDFPESVCVNEDKVEPDLNPKRSAVREIQLVLQPQQYGQHKSLVGTPVIATGTLFGEHTAHHHTPVLLMVRTLEGAAK
jgi:Domain of unknown function (DUF4431)